jgi:uncharacterized protein
MEGIIQKHKPGDKWTDYYKSGLVKRIFNEINDTGWVIHYYENGQIEDSLFSMNNNYAIIGKWNEDGQLIESAGWKNYQYDGEILKYFENGQLRQKANYTNGKVNGKATYYFLSGKVRKIYNYKDSLQDGQQLEYYENGKLHFDTFYKNGVLEGEQKAYDDQ